jgi:hypothetical protein
VCAPVTSINQINQDKSSATFKLVVASVSNNNASSFDDKPSSTFQLVVASVDWKSKAVSNTPFRTLRIDRIIKNKMPSIFQLIVGFKRSIEAFPLFQLIDVSIPDENFSCSVFQMVAYGHNTFIESTSFNDGSFQLVVESILILHSEGVQVASASLQTFADGDQAASQSDTSELIVETPSLLLLCDFERPAITAVMNGSFSFKFIVASHSEGARFAPNFD